MKKLALFVISLLVLCKVYAASTDTIKASTNTLDATITSLTHDITFIIPSYSIIEQPQVPVEEKVVEIHMSRNTSTVEDSRQRKRHKLEPMPLSQATCSGSFVSDKGDVLTARHCVDGFDTFEVQTYDRRKYFAVVIATSTAHDLALIHIDRRNTPYFELTDSITRGQKITVLGSPLGIMDTLSTGVIARIDGDVILMDCSVLPGNSGGPVFDKDEKMVGVATAGFVVMLGMTHLNVAQGADAIYFFLQKIFGRN